MIAVFASAAMNEATDNSEENQGTRLQDVAEPADAIDEHSVATRDQEQSGSAAVPEGQGLAAAERQLSGKLAGLSLKQQVGMLAVWPFLEQLLNFMVGFVDTHLAGHHSIPATAAISVGSYFSWFMNLLQMSVGIGAAAVISRAIGGKHKRVANAALGQAMLLSLVMGILSGALIYLAAPLISSLMNLQGQAYEFGVTYLRIMSLAAVFSSILFVGTACLRAAGDTKSPFVVLAIINVVNTALSWQLVDAGHGVWGIAVGTAVAWLVGSLLICIVLFGNLGGIRLRVGRLRPHWHTAKRILRVAMSNLAESTGMWFGNFLVLGMVGSMEVGTDSTLKAAHIVAIRIEAISFLPCFAVGIAASTLAGQYLGLGDPDRARKAVNYCWSIGAFVMTVLGLIFLLIPEPLVRLMTDKPALLEIAPTLVRICGPVQLFLATSIVLSNAMRGAGDTKTTMKLTYVSIYLVRLPLAYVLAITMGYGLNGLWFALCIELVVRGLIFGARYLHGGWTRVKV